MKREAPIIISSENQKSDHIQAIM